MTCADGHKTGKENPSPGDDGSTGREVKILIPFDDIVNRFTVKRWNAHDPGRRSVQCICPAHDDKQASLTITEADDRVLVHCHAGCETNKVLQSVGLTMKDLLDGRTSWMEYVKKCIAKQGKNVEAVYHYHKPNGEYAFTRLRLVPKDFRYGIIDGDRWIWGLKKQTRQNIPAIYTDSIERLCEAVSRGDRIYYAEGEKDVDRLISAGLVAFTCGSSGDWNSACAELLHGADVVILADNDKSGEKLARQVANDLKSIAKAVRIVTPYTETKGGDVSDYLDAGHTIDDLKILIENSNGKNTETENSNVKNLDRFHLVDNNGRAKGVFDWAIFQHITKEQHLFVLGGVPYIYDGGVYVPDENGSQLKTLIRACIYPEFIKSTTIKRVYDLFVGAAELQAKYDDLNRYPAHWINFKNGFLDPVARVMIPHDPKYKSVNQVPHAYNPDGDSHGDAVEEWLQFIVPDQEDREMLLEFAGYSMTRDVRQQKFMILNGEGGTGKSTVIRMIESVIGSNNLSSISLSELTQRFSSYGLLGKLLNSCADLEISALEDTSTIKKALGEDTLRGEAKGKDAFPFKSYAKLIFSCNELPIVKAEKTNGFYRRLLILTMNKVPTTVKTDLFDQLRNEIDFFIRLSVEALARMYARGTILASDNSAQAVDRLRMDSDTVAAFINEELYPGGRADRAKLFQRYSTYCVNAERQALTKNNFFKSLRAKGYREGKSGGDWYFEGISFEKNSLENSLQDGFVVVNEPLPFM